MSNLLFLDNALQMAKSALDGLSRRQEVLARNIANVDTPGYRAQSVDFESTLKSMNKGTQTARLETTHARHIRGSGSGEQGRFNVLPRRGGNARADGNTVEIDVELMEMAETGIRYQTLTQSVNEKLQLLKTIATRR